MTDLLIYGVSLALFCWVGWDDRSIAFDRDNAVPIAQEGNDDGTHN